MAVGRQRCKDGSGSDTRARYWVDGSQNIEDACSFFCGPHMQDADLLMVFLAGSLGGALRS